MKKCLYVLFFKMTILFGSDNASIGTLVPIIKEKKVESFLPDDQKKPPYPPSSSQTIIPSLCDFYNKYEDIFCHIIACLCCCE